MRKTPAKERFEMFVERIPESGCWVWTGTTGNKGYGQLWEAGRMIRAHRFAFETAFGPIPAGMYVCHRCDVRACVNPAHLFLGTNDENMADMVSKGRQARGERNGQSKLTEQKALAIRADPRPYPQIADAFGISQTQISCIKSNKSWSRPEQSNGN